MKQNDHMLHASCFKLHDRRAFTLVEILVVIGIMSFLSALMIAYSSGSRQRNTLAVESAKMVELVQRAKSLALSTFDQDTPPPPCAYGVWVDYTSDEFTLGRYEKDGSGECPEIGYSGGGPPPQPEDRLDVGRWEIIENERYALPPGVTFHRCPGESDKIEYVLFEPPDPDVWLYAEDGGAQCPDCMLLPQGIASGGIYLLTDDREAGARIEVNRGGQVGVEDFADPGCAS